MYKFILFIFIYISSDNSVCFAQTINDFQICRLQRFDLLSATPSRRIYYCNGIKIADNLLLTIGGTGCDNISVSMKKHVECGESKENLKILKEMNVNTGGNSAGENNFKFVQINSSSGHNFEMLARSKTAAQKIMLESKECYVLGYGGTGGLIKVPIAKYNITDGALVVKDFTMIQRGAPLICTHNGKPHIIALMTKNGAFYKQEMKFRFISEIDRFLDSAIKSTPSKPPPIVNRAKAQ